MYVFIMVFAGHISRDQMAGKGVERTEHKQGQSDVIFEHLERYDMNEEFRIEKWVVELFGYLFVSPFLSLNIRPLKTNDAWFPPQQCLLSAVAITTAVHVVWVTEVYSLWLASFPAIVTYYTIWGAWEQTRDCDHMVMLVNYYFDTRGGRTSCQ